MSYQSPIDWSQVRLTLSEQEVERLTKERDEWKASAHEWEALDVDKTKEIVQLRVDIAEVNGCLEREQKRSRDNSKIYAAEKECLTAENAVLRERCAAAEADILHKCGTCAHLRKLSCGERSTKPGDCWQWRGPQSNTQNQNKGDIPE